jgi:heme/copper-type cytochrome/quinol oxidase subunit 4
MFTFNFEGGASVISIWLVWLLVFTVLFALNEITRRSKIAGFTGFVILPIILSVLWFTILKDTTYTDWFHLVKVYSCTAGCIGFWCIRHIHRKNKKTGKQWHMVLCYNKVSIISINYTSALLFMLNKNFRGE